MKLLRRQFLHLAAGAAALPAVTRIARAQTYPSRPVRIIVGFAPEVEATYCAADRSMVIRAARPAIHHREPAGRRRQHWRRGGSACAARRLHASPGRAASNAVNATLYDKLNFNFIRDIAPVASLVRTPQVMAVNPSVPAKTVPEFIAYAKANPGKISMATDGIGSVQHISGELFMTMTGVDLTPVHYRGDPAALNDLIGGQVQVIFDILPPSLGFIRAGKLRALGVTTATRLDVLPDVAPIGDFVPGYLAGGWLGVGAPKGTPIEIVDKLNNTINAGLADPALKARLADLGSIILAGPPAEFGKLIADETDKWGKVIRAANIKAE